jgi:superfamily II DNA or RNA helicase
MAPERPVRIPYVIDNEEHRLGDVLNAVLAEHTGRSLDVASAYFTVGGYAQLRERLGALGSFRLLLGAEPTHGENVGLRPDPGLVRGLMKRDLDELPFDEATLRLVEDLIAWLREPKVEVRLHAEGFLHAKCWLFYGDRPGQLSLFDRFRPVAAIVGSSNFTAPGLTSNRELNLSHKVLLDPEDAEDRDAALAVKYLADQAGGERIAPKNRQLVKSEVGARAIIELERWFLRQWSASRDSKEELIALLDASKFGRAEYTPWQVYLKALYEYFRDDLEGEELPAMRSAVELSQFQEDAVKRARKILGRYDGVMIADSVGLGKTWIGKKLLEDYAYHLREKALIVCPAALRDMWERELAEAAISSTVLSQEELGRETFEPRAFGDADVVLVDEAHNFRNPSANRYASLEQVLGANGGRGRDGARKKVILLTATPINNDLFDLYNEIALITRGDRSYFAAAGIGDLYRYFLHARRQTRKQEQSLALYNLLEEIVIRRTRPFVRRAYPEATIRGKVIRFPERKLRTVNYDLEATYGGIYEEVVAGIESLELAPYKLETFKKKGIERDEFEEGREQALVGIFKSRYLKRFESSIEAFRISVRRALSFLNTFETYLLDGKLLKSSEFHRAIAYLSREDEEDDAMPGSLADELDANEEARRFLERMASVNTADYDLRGIDRAVKHDVKVLTAIWERVKDIRPEKDAKLQRLKELLRGEIKGRKVLVFTYYKDTARYLYRHLGHPENPAAQAFCKELGGLTVRRMDSGADARERLRIVEAFAPRSNGRPEWAGSEQEIDLLISTDVLSEGQNLQDCGLLLNYDLHWNPTRMVQRAGRIDRLGTEFDELWLYNMFPDEGLERLLRLVESLSAKISAIDQAGFHDASVLGELVHPQNFNTLRRIREADGTVIQEEEQAAELVSNESLAHQLRQMLEGGAREMVESLPDGIHSGLVKPNAKGVFFYFQARHGDEREHFWRYYDLKSRAIAENRYLIANLIQCEPSTPRVVEPGALSGVFALQEEVIVDVLKSVAEQKALEVAPRTIDPVQQTVATAIQGYLNHPELDRKEAIELIRFLNQPMLSVQIRHLRAVLKSFKTAGQVKALIEEVRKLRQAVSEPQPESYGARQARKLEREDLRLVCFEFLSGG